MAARMWDHFTIEVVCQHCGQYLTIRVGIERKHLAAARELVRQKSVEHAKAVGQGARLQKMS